MVDRDKIESLIRHLGQYTSHLWDVDDQLVYEGIRSELGDFETFVEYIVAYLEQTAH